ncbi:hypothetical protein [uncultured Sphingomonas sp.]|uniref:hypothetical protein n=1 Tax=uncultured Sphingomonas sp. TaxID=158754 RepID=UPI0035CA811A
MEQEQFIITTDPAKKLVHVVMKGFWISETVFAYDREIRAAADRMAAAGHPRHELLALVDAREAGVQTGELIFAYRERFGAPARQPRRVATIVSSALFKRQVERIAIPNQRIFDNEVDAMRWLLSPDDRQEDLGPGDPPCNGAVHGPADR